MSSFGTDEKNRRTDGWMNRMGSSGTDEKVIKTGMGNKDGRMDNKKRKAKG